jgi:murein DD-endopeptidase MepM/ murein hydrolase activator NlpD
VLAGFGVLLLSGCSSDVTRFSQSGNPFSSPFPNQTAGATPAVAAAPTPGVAAAPAQPVTVAAAGHSPPAPAAQPVGGSAIGWTAVGGSPIVVAEGETLDTLSTRYGVPTAALLKANGLSSASQVKGGMRIVVPVYHADGHDVASAAQPKPAKKHAEEAADAGSSKAAKKRAEVVADAGSSKAAKVKDKKDKAVAKAEKPAPGAAPAPSKDAANPAVAYAEPFQPSQVKKQAIDSTPTGNVEPGAAQTKVPLTGAQAEAAGVEPEFRWPARGRIIQGFKSGGNDGINISVPAGTSVRAAESGVVVYAGDGLKGYGNLVLIKHPNGFVTAYGNNAELAVKRGEQVKRGQVIAKSGDTGNVNSPQLHFELRKGSTPVDPTNYLAGL